MQGVFFRLTVLLVILLSGCAFREEGLKPYSMITDKQVQIPEDIRLAAKDWPARDWWTQYNDPQLNALVNLALEGNQTVLAAHARISLADSQVRLARAAGGPQLGMLGLIDRQNVSANGFLGPFAKNEPELGLTGPWYTSGLLGLTGSLNLDLWGKNRAQVNAAIGVSQAKQAELAMIRLDLSTRVAQLYFSLQKTRAVIELLTQCRNIQTDMLLGYQARRAIGLESETAAQLVSAQKLQTDAALSVEESKSIFLREALRALVGANTDLPDRLNFTALPASHPGMPDNLQFNLLARRPDLQALRSYVASSLSQVDAAQAEFYPSFDIQAFFGVYSIHIADLFSMNASRQINLIPGMRLPIFDSGLLNANLDARSASANESVALYNQAVVDAVRDVAQLGSTLKDLEKRLTIEKDRLSNLSFAGNGAKESHARGLISRLESEQARLPVLIQQALLEELQSQQLMSELGLIRALGGGG